MPSRFDEHDRRGEASARLSREGKLELIMIPPSSLVPLLQRVARLVSNVRASTRTAISDPSKLARVFLEEWHLYRSHCARGGSTSLNFTIRLIPCAHSGSTGAIRVSSLFPFKAQSCHGLSERRSHILQRWNLRFSLPFPLFSPLDRSREWQSASAWVHP